MSKPTGPISAIRVGNVISLVAGGKHLMRDIRVDEIEKAVKTFNEYQTDKNWEKLESLINPISSLVATGEVISDDYGNLYLEGSNVAIPSLLAKRILEYKEKGLPIHALKNFWHLSLFNPDPVARNDFFGFCDRNNIPITDMGYAVIYKTVTHVNKKVDMEKDLRSFVAASYLKVKRQKKSPKNFTVYKDHEGYGYTGGKTETKGSKSIGNLQELHDKLATLEQGTRYTDKFTKTMDIQLGVPVCMDRAKCDSNPRSECSKGLHVGGWSYVKDFGFGYKGYENETVLATLVNPMNVVAVPYATKMRVCEYYPYAIMEMDKETGEWTEIDTPYLEESYINYEVEELKKKLHNIEENLTSGNIQTKKEQLSIIKDRLVLIGHEGEEHEEIRNLTKIFVEEYEDEITIPVDENYTVEIEDNDEDEEEEVDE